MRRRHQIQTQIVQHQVHTFGDFSAQLEGLPFVAKHLTSPVAPFTNTV